VKNEYELQHTAHPSLCTEQYTSHLTCSRNFILGKIIKICHERSSLLNIGQKYYALYKTQEFLMLFTAQQYKTELTVAFPWQHF